MKDDETKNVVLLKDGLKELIESYPNTFNTIVRNEVREPAAKEEDMTTKTYLKRFFLMALIL